MKNYNMNQKLGALLQGLGSVIQNPPRRISRPLPPRTFFTHRPGLQARALPGWMSRLDLKCHSHKHFAPMPMAFVRFSHSDNGHGVAQYKCPSCGGSHFMALNDQNKAFCLFTK